MMSDVHDDGPAALDLPDREALVRLVEELALRNETARLVLDAVRSGRFSHPDGRVDELNEVRLGVDQLGLIAFLAPRAPKSLTIDVGFGMGSSSAMALAAREDAGLPLDHVVFDPYGLSGGAGSVVADYLAQTYGDGFTRIWELSEIGLAVLCHQRGAGSAGMAFIDGNHRFDNIIVDFVLADHLCAPGGALILDDALFPAIETAVNFIERNRPELQMYKFPVYNTCLLYKLRDHELGWADFEPFDVPNRRGWTA